MGVKPRKVPGATDKRLFSAKSYRCFAGASASIVAAVIKWHTDVYGFSFSSRPVELAGGPGDRCGRNGAGGAREPRE